MKIVFTGYDMKQKNGKSWVKVRMPSSESVAALKAAAKVAGHKIKFTPRFQRVGR